MIRGKILLIDDDDDDQLIFKDALKEIDFTCDCLFANNGLEALAILANEHEIPAIIFLDLNMPLMNGVEFLIHVKKEKSLANIPVVIFSTSNNPADKEQMLSLGAKLFITKTSNFKLLKDKLADLLIS
jgi:CheY-like chemotaxis protein